MNKLDISRELQKDRQIYQRYIRLIARIVKQPQQFADRFTLVVYYNKGALELYGEVRVGNVYLGRVFFERRSVWFEYEDTKLENEINSKQEPEQCGFEIDHRDDQQLFDDICYYNFSRLRLAYEILGASHDATLDLRRIGDGQTGQDD